MAIKLYNPKTGVFANRNMPDSELPFNEVMLVNIFIELQVMNTYLEALVEKDNSDSLRTDVVSNL